MRDALKFFPSVFKTLAKSEIKIAEKIVGETGKNINDILAKQAGIFMDEKDIKKYKTVSQKLASTASEKDISKWSEETMKTALSSEVFHKSLKGSKISAMAKQFGDDFFEAFRDNVANEEWYKREAPAAHKYISYSAGQNLGIGFGKESKKTPGSLHEDTQPIIIDTNMDKTTPTKKPEEGKEKKGKSSQFEAISPGTEEPSDEPKEEDSSQIV